MTLARPRFNVRSLMIAVLISGAAIAILERAWRFDHAAQSHSSLEASARLRAEQVMEPRGSAICVGADGRTFCRSYYAPGAAHLRDLCLAAVEYHSEMASKYRRAASRPWLAVAADPPEPELPELPKGFP